MISCETKLKTWGNSYGVVIPKSLVKRGGFKKGCAVKITLNPVDETTVEDIFGRMPKVAKNIEKSLAEIDKELDDQK